MSPTEKFRRCDAVTAAWEGGYVDHPRDPGGPTDRGVTQAVYDDWRQKRGLPRKSVKGITAAEAEALFFSQYWEPCGCERLAAGVDLAIYDASVNSGVSRGRKWLLASIGGPDHETVKKICARRLGFMQSLKIWQTFGKGWGRRVADIQAKGVAWALAASAHPDMIPDALQQEAAGKEKVVVRQTRAATGTVATGAAGAGTGVVDQSANAADWLLIGGGVALIVVAGLIVIRLLLNSQQAKAFAAEADRLALVGGEVR